MSGYLQTVHDLVSQGVIDAAVAVDLLKNDPNHVNYKPSPLLGMAGWLPKPKPGTKPMFLTGPLPQSILPGGNPILNAMCVGYGNDNFLTAVQALLDRGDVSRGTADDLLSEYETLGYGNWDRLFENMKDRIRPLEATPDWNCGPLW